MDKEKLHSLLYDLIYVRAVEEKICELYPEQEMRCPVHLSIGQEATAVGVCKNLTNQDLVFSTHRGHSHYLAKGGDLKSFFAELYGKSTGCAKGRGGSMHIVDVAKGFMGCTAIVSGTIPVGVGSGLTMSIQGSNNVVVIFIGDAAFEEGVMHESLNFAKLKNLPVLFFCENNLYSVYSSLSVRQPQRKIVDIVRAHGLDCRTIDGNNVIEVYETTGEVVEKIRLGGGPAFIEAYTYRWLEHCGPNYDNHIGYRTQEEFLQWKEKDPVQMLSVKLLNECMITHQEIVNMEIEINKKVEESVLFAKSSPFPLPEELSNYIYAD